MPFFFEREVTDGFRSIPTRVEKGFFKMKTCKLSKRMIVWQSFSYWFFFFSADRVRCFRDQRRCLVLWALQAPRQRSVSVRAGWQPVLPRRVSHLRHLRCGPAGHDVMLLEGRTSALPEGLLRVSQRLFPFSKEKRNDGGGGGVYRAVSLERAFPQKSPYQLFVPFVL